MLNALSANGKRHASVTTVRIDMQAGTESDHPALLRSAVKSERPLLVIEFDRIWLLERHIYFTLT